MSPPTLFLLKIVLAVWSPLQFHMNLKIGFSIFIYFLSHWNFDRDCIQTVDCLGNIGILISSLPIHEHGTYFHLFGKEMKRVVKGGN